MDEFWANIEDIANVRGNSILQCGQVVDLYIDIVGENWDFLVEDEPLVCARMLLNSDSMKQNVKFTRQRLLISISCLKNKSPGWACFLAVLLGIDDTALDMLSQDHIQEIVDLIWMYRFTEKRCITLYMQLLFVVLMRNDNTDLKPYSLPFCQMLLENVCESEIDQGIGLAAFKLAAALNHKFTIGPSVDTNSIMDALRINVPKFHRFGGCLIWHFNRHRTSTSQLLACKLLYQVLSSEDTSDILYFNDLKVLVDILIRELADINRENERLRELYLLVLLRVLQKDALTYDPYKRSVLVSSLRASLEHTIDKNIINLINDCLGVPWLGWNNSVHVSPHSSRDNLVLATKVSSIGGETEGPFQNDNFFSPPHTPKSPSPPAFDQPEDMAGPISPIASSPPNASPMKMSTSQLHNQGFNYDDINRSPFEDKVRPIVPPRRSNPDLRPTPAPPPPRRTAGARLKPPPPPPPPPRR